ncbi:hypothetical protein WG902_16310 [Ramlibacter sp. PS3R-8]|uniref:hypothetical protein n=1 Tax=Ramlibacter sp. PS3R-8 TaxID=3133437 RepID=UPI00309F66D1
MLYPMVRSFLVPLAAATLLAACGGGEVAIFIEDDFGNENSYSSGRVGTVDVVSPQDTRFSGTYTTNDVQLTGTYRFAPAGTIPATCRFRFAGLQLDGRNAFLDGEIRYRVNSTEVVTSFLAINGLAYRLDDSAAVVVNKDLSRIRFQNATLSSRGNPAETITVTGFIPYRSDNLPNGC